MRAVHDRHDDFLAGCESIPGVEVICMERLSGSSPFGFWVPTVSPFVLMPVNTFPDPSVIERITAAPRDEMSVPSVVDSDA